MAEIDLEALAARVEKLEGPDRVKDYLIADALLGSINPPYRRGHCEKYTASIDAAQALVPEGWWWKVGECSVSSDATVGPDVAHCPKDLLIRFDEGIQVIIEPPTSTAIALAAACLRAHAALRMEAGEGE